MNFERNRDIRKDIGISVKIKKDLSSIIKEFELEDGIDATPVDISIKGWGLARIEIDGYGKNFKKRVNKKLMEKGLNKYLVMNIMQTKVSGFIYLSYPIKNKYIELFKGINIQ
jgi:hypothetical protein